LVALALMVAGSSWRSGTTSAASPRFFENNWQRIKLLLQGLAQMFSDGDLSRADVVRKIAQDNGYGATRQDIEYTAHRLPVITQARMTDAQLIRRLADREGFEFYVDERGSNAKTQRDSLAPIIEIVDPETGATRLERRNIADDIRSTAEPSAATAKREADARYRQAQHLTVELSATVISDPSLLAKTVVEIQGISQRLSGKYYLREAKHKVDGSGFTVDLKCLRDGHSELGGPPSKGKPNRGKPDDNDPDALRPVEVVDPETGQTRIEYRPTHGRSAAGES
jgi:uncharacterized protein